VLTHETETASNNIKTHNNYANCEEHDDVNVQSILTSTIKRSTYWTLGNPSHSTAQQYTQ